jgi:hypothetical protein
MLTEKESSGKKIFAYLQGLFVVSFFVVYWFFVSVSVYVRACYDKLCVTVLFWDLCVRFSSGSCVYVLFRKFV